MRREKRSRLADGKAFNVIFETSDASLDALIKTRLLAFQALQPLIQIGEALSHLVLQKINSLVEAGDLRAKFTGESVKAYFYGLLELCKPLVNLCESLVDLVEPLVGLLFDVVEPFIESLLHLADSNLQPFQQLLVAGLEPFQ